MIRTIEVLFVIIILSGAFVAVSYFTVLPSPREVSPINLRRLSFTTLQALDSNYELSQAAFDTDNSTAWSGLQVALSASLPPEVVYNLTVYDVNDAEGQIYNYVNSISNAVSLGTTNDVSTYAVGSSNVTFNFTPQKIGEDGNGGTLYILNCSDANGWWVSGYTAQSLAQDLYNLLSPYFVKTVMVQNTAQLAQILGGTSLQGENLRNAVVINTCGEAAPIPTAYCQAPYSQDSYAYYNYYLGQRVNLYNWTWSSIVGYPFYYVSNTVAFSSGHNTWGIYGMQSTGPSGSRAFLEGINNQSYVRNTNDITDKLTRQVTFTQNIAELSNYYGVYPSIYQTSTRALSNTTLSSYNLKIGLNIFNPSDPSKNYLAGAVYNHYATGSTNITGSLLALGLTRTPDVRVTGLSLLSYYHPRLYASEYSTHGTSRIVILQLGLVGSG
jgi:hypothetical protein